MTVKKQVENLLHSLFEASSQSLRREFSLTKSRDHTFSKVRRQKVTENLKQLLLRLKSRRELSIAKKSAVAQKRQWHVKRGKGWGVDSKKRRFKEWFAEQCRYQNYVYVFNSGKRCVYVGQSAQGKTRPENHFEKHWFASVTRIDVMSVPRKSELARLECLAIHHYQPTRNKYRPPNKRWTKKCPICAAHRVIEREVRKLFPIKKRVVKKSK